MAGSRKPQTPDEPTVKEARALKAPGEKSVGRGRKLSGEHHEVTGSGPGLPLRDAQPKVRPPTKHAVPAEVTAGRGLALKLSSSEEVTARGAAVKESAGAAEAAKARGAASLAAATSEAARRSTGSNRRLDTQDETRDRAAPPDDAAPPRLGDEQDGEASARSSHPALDPVELASGDAEPPAGEEDDDADALPGAPPDADEVALRALAVAALLLRASHEARPNNASEVRQLQSWVDAFGLYASFGAGAFELFDASHGSWAAEDRTAVAWLAEELRLLLWALGREAGLPAPFERSDAKAGVKLVPVLEPPQAFVAKATLRGLDELEQARAFYEVLREAAQCEAWARGILDEPALAEEEADDLEDILAAAEGPHFDRAAVEKKQGKAAAAVAGLRAWSRTLLEDLFSGGSPHAALAFEVGALEAMEAHKLATVLALAQTRTRALEWLTEGDEWDVSDDGDEDDAVAEDEG